MDQLQSNSKKDKKPKQPPPVTKKRIEKAVSKAPEPEELKKRKRPADGKM